MIKKEWIYFVLITLVIGFEGCRVKEEITVEPASPPPYWVVERPTNSQEYTGIGIANKALSGSNYMQIAKENALNDLVSEIKVNVEGSSLLYTMENETGFKEDFSSTTKLSSSVKIEGYEQVGVYETPEVYYVYYKLNKLTYKELRAAKINTAISLSKQNRAEAIRQFSQSNIAQSLQNYYQALVSIAPFLNEPLKATIDGEETYYGSLLLKEIQEVVNQLVVNPLQKEITVNQGIDIPQNKTTFKLEDKKGKPQEGIKVAFLIADEVLLKDRTITDYNGQAVAIVGKIKSIGSHSLTAHLNIEINSKQNKVVNSIMNSINWPSNSMLIKVDMSKVYLIINQKRYGKDISTEKTRQLITTAAANNNFQIIDNKQKANLIATLKLDSKESGVFQELYNVDFIGTITIIDPVSNTEIFRESFDNIRGVDLNYDRAYKKGLAAFEKRIVFESVPRFRRKHLD